MTECRRRSIVPALLCAVVLSGCKDNGVTEPGDPSLTIEAGATATDTIQATLVQSLVVRVRDGRGRPAAGQIVRFEPLVIIHRSGLTSASVHMSLAAANDFTSTSRVVTTDADGRASVMVRLGTTAGIGGIEVSVPQFGIADTATHVITPGAGVRVVAEPGDTVVYIGGTLTLRAAVTDRFANWRADPVSLTRLAGGVSLQGQTLSAQTGGVAKIVATAGTMSDTSVVAVVPPGTLAVGNRLIGVATVNLDGSGYRVVTPTGAQYVRWAPDGTSITFDNGYSLPAKVVTMEGVVRPVRPSSENSGAEMYPIYSPDGAWIYLTVFGAPEYAYRLWRARADGSEAARLVSSSPEEDMLASPSPDGTRLVYVRRIGESNDTLRILDLASGAVTRIGVPGHAPAWSPLGDLIAYVDLKAGGVLSVVRPDGTGRRPVSADGNYEMAVSWSPDGAWLVAHNYTTHKVHLVEVATGATIPLAFSAEMYAPAWKP